MEEAAELLAGKKVAFVIGHGISLQRHGIEAVDAIVNLSLLTGSARGQGGGLYAIARENNEAGAWDMGTVPDAFPGREPLTEIGARKHWERAWHVNLSPDPGMGVARMIAEAEKGNLKAMVIMGENPVRALPESHRVSEALKKLELLVVQDILETETTRHAHVILPGAAFSEKSGSFTNMEGRIQSFEPAVPLPAEAKPDWEILDLLGRKLGAKDPYRSLSHIRHEIATLVPGYQELARSQGTAWVKEANRSRPLNPEGEAGVFSFSPYSPIPSKGPVEGYPLKAIFGSPRSHLGSGTRTARSERIRDYPPGEEVEVSLEDGGSLGIGEGETVTIVSAHGAIQRKVTLTPGIAAGLIYVPRAVHGNSANSLIPLAPPGGRGVPGMNVIPVKIEKGTG